MHFYKRKRACRQKRVREDIVPRTRLRDECASNAHIECLHSLDCLRSTDDAETRHDRESSRVKSFREVLNATCPVLRADSKNTVWSHCKLIKRWSADGGSRVTLSQLF